MSPDGKYFYSKKLEFGDRDYISVYQTKTGMYKTANYVDGLSSGIAIMSAAKLGIKAFTLMTTGAACFTPMFGVSSGFWALLCATQYQYLKHAYLQQVYLIDRIELKNDLENIRIKTILND